MFSRDYVYFSKVCRKGTLGGFFAVKDIPSPRSYNGPCVTFSFEETRHQTYKSLRLLGFFIWSRNIGEYLMGSSEQPD